MSRTYKTDRRCLPTSRNGGHLWDFERIHCTGAPVGEWRVPCDTCGTLGAITVRPLLREPEPEIPIVFIENARAPFGRENIALSLATLAVLAWMGTIYEYGRTSSGWWMVVSGCTAVLATWAMHAAFRR